MASNEYLSLLDQFAHVSRQPGTSGDGYDALERAWGRMGSYPAEYELMNLARICIEVLSRETELHATEIVEGAKTLHVTKNAGYAGLDNADPWANFRLAQKFCVTPFIGVMIRISDKYIRIFNLRRNPANEMVNETIVDTVTDLFAYALIAICLLREEVI